MTDLHHDDCKGDGEAGDAPHEGSCSNEGKSPRVHPGPRAGGQEDPWRRPAYHMQAVHSSIAHFVGDARHEASGLLNCKSGMRQSETQSISDVGKTARA